MRGRPAAPTCYMKPAPTPTDEACRLRRLLSMELLDTGAEDALDSFTDLASRLTGMPIALISLLDTERQWFKSAVGLPQGAQTPRDVSFCGHAILQDDIFEIEDAPNHPDFADNPLVTGPPHVVHYAGAPLQMPTGERIGTLCLIDRKPGKLTPRDRELLLGLARSVVQTLVLRESDRRLRRHEQMGLNESLAEFSPVGMFALDAQGAVVHANERWARLLGIAELIDGLGWGWTDTVHPDDIAGLEAQWRDAVHGGQSFETRVRTRAAHGTSRWLRLRLEPAQSAQSAAAFVGAVIDITEKVKLEDALRERNDLLESVIAHLPNGLAVFDAQRRHLVSNQRMAALMDLPRELLLRDGLRYEDVVHFNAARGEYGPGDPREAAAPCLALAHTVGEARHERTRPDGTVLEVRTASMPNGWLVQVYTDVTPLRRAEKDARKSGQRLSLAMETVGLGLWEYKPQTDEVHLSDSWSAFFGNPSQPRVVRRAQLTDMAPAYATEEYRNKLEQLLSGEIALMNIEHEMLNASGESLWVVTRAQVTDRDELGRPTCVVGTTKDVTERRRTQHALRDSVEAANAANRAKADFLATMSHEIRTPINGVIGLARMLADAQLPHREAEHVRMINSCANSLLDLVNEVLDFSKIEAGQMVLEQVDTDLHALAQETADIFSARAFDKGVGFSVHLGQDVPRWIVCDSHRLRQILLNLLGNALKFTAQGSFALRLAVAPGPDGARQLRLDVTDTGIGISAEGLGRLFKRFSQADASTTRRFQGTGLGLAISRDLARLMGGDVTVTSTLGAGSTFTVMVPLVEAAARQAKPQAPAELPATRTPQDTPVLLVEDNAINQLVARSLLAKLGYTQVTIAEHGQAALDACDRDQFALVLMDCQMPVMDGFEATRRLRERGYRRPIIALTAGAVKQDRDACLEAGMDDYLAKPIDAALLAGTVNHWLNTGAPTPGGARNAALSCA